MNWIKNLLDPEKEDSSVVYGLAVIFAILVSTGLMFLLFLADR